jgi:hypothetical protein
MLEYFISLPCNEKLFMLEPEDTFYEIELFKKIDSAFFTLKCVQNGSVLYKFKKELK